ncbi:MAG: immunoglobulin domain-containing protein, partial [Verrucomicrobiota bacterium]|nr:immunoglobulin domain-containing protein [Verrucomicrobiota bacterium]
RRSFVGLTDELFSKLDGDATRLITAAIDWTGGTGFTSKPSGSELLAGENVTLSAAGYGPGDVGYQWKKNGANLDGKTGSSLTLENVAKADAGNYSVVVTSSSGDTAQASAAVKVYSLPIVDFRAPGAGKTTAAVTHQVKLWALGGVDKIDLASATVAINGVDVTAKGKVTSNIRGVQFRLDLVENTSDVIAGDFLGIENLTAGANNAMTLTLSYKAGDSTRVFSNEWSYTLHDNSSGSSDVAKMAINQIFEQGYEMYVVWPGSPGLVLERNSDCKGGVWEALPNTVGKGLHIEPNCGTKAFFRLVRIKE